MGNCMPMFYLKSENGKHRLVSTERQRERETFKWQKKQTHWDKPRKQNTGLEERGGWKEEEAEGTCLGLQWLSLSWPWTFTKVGFFRHQAFLLLLGVDLFLLPYFENVFRFSFQFRPLTPWKCVCWGWDPIPWSIKLVILKSEPNYLTTVPRLKE